jgi:curved DNA-binding protein CbpA
MSGTRDAYRILQVDPSAVPEVIEAAYRALARLHHPDLSETTDAGDAMTELNWAYGTLHDPALRAAYDRTRIAIPIAPPPGSLRERVQEVVAAAEQQGSRPGSVVLDFGRYEGMSLAQIARTDPAYLEWLKRHSSGVRYRHAIDELLGAAAARRA